MGFVHLSTGRVGVGLRAASLAVTLSVGFSLSALAIEVVSTSPDAYALGVPRNLAEIVVQFDEAPNLPGVPVRVAGTMSGLHAVTTSVDGNDLTIHVDPYSFFVGEMVRVNLHRNISGNATGGLTGGYYFTFTAETPGGSGNWEAAEIFDAAIIPYFIYGGDLNGDDRPDLAVPNEGTNDVSVYLNQGDTIGELRTEYGVGDKPSSIFGEDFDNDGDQDLATAEIISGTMSVLRNNGSGVFAPATVYPSGSVCRQVHGGDFDGDLDVDLCTTSRGTNQAYLFYNGGAGGFGTGQTYSGVASGPFTIHCEDFNLDGHLDIAVGCQTADLVSILLNNGTGGFTTLGSYPTGDGPWDMVANDFDGDGDCDLLTVLSFGSQIAVLRNDGTGAFPTRTTAVTDAFPLGVHATDIDGDGDIDAISSNFNGGTANLFANNGAGALSRIHTFDVNMTGSYGWASDLDGDADLDVTIVDENADLLFVFYQSGVPTGTPTVPGTPGDVSLLVRPQPMQIGEGTSLLMRNVFGRVDVEIFAPDGRKVREISSGRDGEKNPVVTWDGRDQTGREVAPGRYFLRLRTADGTSLSGQVIAVR